MMKATKFRWVIILLLFIVTVINYVDRSAISFAIPKISTLFHLNSGQAGLILGAFGIGYMIMSFFGGILADRVGARYTLFFMSILWAIAIGLTGLAVGFVMVYFMRILLGLAEGPNFPSMNRAVSDWLSKDERAIALSNSLVAVPIANAIGAVIVSGLISLVDWRWTFIILAIAGLIWTPLWIIFFRDRPEQSKFVNEAELRHIHSGLDNEKGDHEEPASNKKEVQGLWKFLFTNPTLLANDWAFFVFGYYVFFFMTWLPSYLEKVYGLKLTSIGLFSVIPWVLAAIFLYALGYISDAILKKTGSLRKSRSHPIWITQLLAAICILPVIFTHSLTVSLIFISLAVAFGMGSNSTFYAINVDVAQERSGTALGVMDTFFAIAGIIAPTITGWIVQTTGNFTNAFWLLAILALTSVLAVLFFHNPDKSKHLSDMGSDPK
ncbi:MFS transporter [Scopulibacillus cellulosilyticus]|uniref:MFS transporter n=1 Tax=Scopulibacillus cellulosilyticus TaxID=2665665 RepID=A0ABW2Q1G4_9BACL